MFRNFFKLLTPFSSCYLIERVRNEKNRKRTKVKDSIEKITKMAWRWVEHVARQDVERWTRKLRESKPRETKKSVGWPQNSLVDDIRTVAGKQWMRVARN